MPNRIQASSARWPLAAANPISGGIAPGIAPTVVQKRPFALERRIDEQIADRGKATEKSRLPVGKYPQFNSAYDATSEHRNKRRAPPKSFLPGLAWYASASSWRPRRARTTG